jgi:hypothetical protein
VTATPEERREGRASKVEVRGTNVRFLGGLIIARVDLGAEGVEVDTDLETVRTEGPARLRAELTENHLASLLEKKAEGKLQRVRVKFTRDRVVVKGRVRVAGLRLPVTRTTSPELRDNTVYVHTYRMTVAGIRVPQRMVRKQDRQLGPLLDLGVTGVAMKLERYAIEDDRLVIEGTFDLTTPLREPAPERKDKQERRGK